MAMMKSLKWFVCLAAALTIAGAQAPKSKVILDTDIGDDIDDAWSLAFILSHPGFEPLGVTTAHGDTEGRAKIVCKMLYVTGRNEIPVAVGRRTDPGRRQYQFTWAENFEKLKPARRDAPRFIVETAKKYPGEVTLVAVGPLENVADALRLEPGLGKILKRVVLMSGCIYGTADRASPIAEYNVRAAAQDAQLVYAAGLPMTIVPLDSTTRVQLRQDERNRVRDYDSPLTFSLEALYRLWLDSPDSRMTLHDQLAAAETASPGTFFGKQEKLPISVDGKGFTRVDRAKGKPVVVCLEPKRDEFMRYYIGTLTRQRLGR